jgi:integrase
MPRLKLTQAAIRRLQPDPNGRQVLYWDTEQRGFGVLVSGKTNARSYVVQREVNGLTRRVTLGTVQEYEAAERTLQDARHQAAELVLEMRNGKDPKARRGPKAGITLRAVLERYLEEEQLSANSKALYRHWIQHWLNDWLDQPLRNITPEMVESRFRRIKTIVASRANGSAQTSEPGAGTANAVMRALRALWNHAQDTVPDLPPTPVKLKKRWFAVPERERNVSGDQLAKFYRAVTDLPSTTMRDYILLLLFTGLRKAEAAGLKWADLDFSQRIIRLPARRTKAKRKLDLPMSRYVYDLLAARRAIGVENAFVFPGNGAAGHLTDPKSALHGVGGMCGVYVSPHDLRRTFVTVAAQCRIPPMALSGLVNHSVGTGITAGYARLNTADLAEAMEIISERILELCGR